MDLPELGTDRVLVHVTDGIGWLIFNNPERHNALTAEMAGASATVLHWLQAHPGVRVIVMRGAGDRAFCSGLDVSQPAPGGGAGALAAAWSAVDKPVIGMLRGYCLGMGLLTALQADIRISDDTGVFAIPAARMGIGYGYEPTLRLLQAVGPARAADILFTGRHLDAREALAAGILSRVVAPSELEREVTGVAGTIAQNAPLTIRGCKAAIRAALADPGDRNLDQVAALVRQCMQSGDYQEGRRAFLEKRPPRFAGH